MAARRKRAAKEAAAPASDEPRGLFEAPTLHAVPLRSAWPHMFAVFVGLMAVYAATAARTVVLEDDGEFVMAAYYLGVAHPPGYPLFVLLAHPFTWLPFGSVALRVHLASGFFAAGACATLWWVARALVPSHAAAYVASLALGVSGAFWSQAIIADVYSLNVLLFVSMLAAVLVYLHGRGTGALLALFGLAGLGLANHWPLTVLALPCLPILLLPAGRSIGRSAGNVVIPGVLTLLLGLSPFLWMYLRSQAAPELAFAGAIESWQELTFYLSRGPYSDSSLTAGWADKAGLALFLVRESVMQFTPLGFLLVAVGALAPRRPWTKSFALGLWATFLLTPAALVLLRDIDYDLQARAITRVFPLIPYAVMSLWLAAGLDRAVAWATARGRSDRMAALGLGILVVGATLLVGWGRNDRRTDRLAHDYAMAVLSSFDRDGTVFLQHDFDTFPMQYLHFVEGVRPDLRLWQNQGLSMALDGRPFTDRVDPSRRLTGEARLDSILSFVAGSEGPVYFTAGTPASLSDVDYGFYKRIDRATEGQTTWIAHEGLLTFFRGLLEEPDGRDEVRVWTRDFLIRRMTPPLAALVEVPPVSQELVDRYGADLEAASRTLPGLLARIEVLESRGGASPERRLDMVTEAQSMQGQAVGKSQHAAIYLHKGRVLRELGRIQEADAAFARSAEIFPHPLNDAFAERAGLGFRTPS